MSNIIKITPIDTEYWDCYTGSLIAHTCKDRQEKKIPEVYKIIALS